MAARMSAKCAARVLLQQPGVLYFSRAPTEGTRAWSSNVSDCVSQTARGGVSEFMRGFWTLCSLNRGISSSSEGSDKSSTDRQREDILETGKRVDVTKVKDVPSPSKQKWWKPDPITGVWVPEDSDVQVDTAQQRLDLLN